MACSRGALCRRRLESASAAPAGVGAAVGSREQRAEGKDGGAGEAVLAAGQQAEGLMLRVRQLIDSYDSIECGTRHQIDLFDHQILGAGHYYQQGHGLRRLSRFELRSQIGNRTTTLFELSDGNYLWTFRENLAATTLTRVELAARCSSVGTIATRSSGNRGTRTGGWRIAETARRSRRQLSIRAHR